MCIETRDRAQTIRAALLSLTHQTFRDFEVLVVDNLSDDGTAAAIRDFFASPEFQKASFPHTFSVNQSRLPDLENWNTPLKSARGRYIAILEGDDEFRPNHLAKAHAILSADPQIGIYATGRQDAERPVKGRITAREYFRMTLGMWNVSAPSETVFVRQHLGKPFLFDASSHVYCPETSLYLDIASCGYDAYHDAGREVVR
ncbi:MAG: glycosyltransferase family 2 protein, partial [Elusimicrobia bacterium]|nr:glycosyltransferase family 2 protein [Elusimicrobiota bacterium]